MKKEIEIPEGYEVKLVLSDDTAEHPIGQWVKDEDNDIYACRTGERSGVSLDVFSGEYGEYDDVCLHGQHYQPVTDLTEFSELSQLFIKEAKRRYPKRKIDESILRFNGRKSLLTIKVGTEGELLFSLEDGWTEDNKEVNKVCDTCFWQNTKECKTGEPCTETYLKHKEKLNNIE